MYNTQHTTQLVDTPGFGDADVQGLDGGTTVQRDQKHMRAIKQFFQKTIHGIDAVCFVIKSTANKLTETQLYIFDQVNIHPFPHPRVISHPEFAQIFSMFGNDIAHNFFVLMTFADIDKPPAKATVSAYNKELTQHFHWLKLNNSGFFVKKEKDKGEGTDIFHRKYWEIGINCFREFCLELRITTSRSLDLTRRVLFAR